VIAQDLSEALPALEHDAPALGYPDPTNDVDKENQG